MRLGLKKNGTPWKGTMMRTKTQKNGWRNKMHSLKGKGKKQKDEVPARFDPKEPVTILQRRHYTSALTSGQVPQRLKDSKYTQSQPNNWMAGYEGTWYRKEFGAGYSLKDRKWPQENGYGKRYGTGEKKRTDKSYISQ